MKKQILFLFICLSHLLSAQTVDRGPYLQSPNHNSIIVMWRTTTNTSTKIWYGTDSLNLTQNAEISNNVKDHEIKITGLQPYTKYYYKIGDLSSQYTPATGQSFKTHPLPGTKGVPTRIWATGDFGKGNSKQIDTKLAFEAYSGVGSADVWLWLGDNAYDDGNQSQYQAKVFAVPGYSDVFPHQPFWASPGNHDYNTVWSESTLLGIPYSNIPLSNHMGPYFDIVEVPQNGEAGGYPSNLEVFYSFDYADVHFLSLNSEVFDYTLSYDGMNAMTNWIIQDLSQSNAKFKIAYWHQPPYTKGSHDSDGFYELVMKAVRERIIPVLEEHGIDLIVCGHSHVFERSYLLNGHYSGGSSFNINTMAVDASSGNFDAGTPYIKDTLVSTQDGTVYIVCGNSGSSTSGVGEGLDYPAMYYSDAYDAAGSFVIDIYKNRLDGYYLKSDGTIPDEFTLLKKDLRVNAMADFSICQGESVDVIANYTGGSDSMNFVWTGSTAVGETVTLSPTTTTNYTLEITDFLTGQIETSSFTINVSPTPQPNVDELTSGTLNANLSGSQYTYQWFINGNPISGATNETYQPIIDGNYTVEVYNSNTGCTVESSSYSFYGLPTEAYIDTLGDSLITVEPIDTAYTYQWYLNDTAIAGANNTSYTYTESGDYYVEVILPNGDTLQSNTITVVFETLPPTSILDVANNVSTIYPNPASEQIILELFDNKYNTSPYSIINTTGKTVLNGVLTGTNTPINISKLSTGVYFLKIEADVPVYNKFVKK
ncbi:MAG: metallophosphoesterase [Chitinophagales bacterium]